MWLDTEGRRGGGDATDEFLVDLGFDCVVGSKREAFHPSSSQISVEFLTNGCRDS